VDTEFWLKLGQRLLKEFKQDKLLFKLFFKNIMTDESIQQEYLILQQQLRNVLIQKETIKLQIAEIDSALSELEKTKEEKVYKVVGNVMIKKSKEEVEKELKEGKEDLQIRVESLEKIEKDLIEKIKNIEEKLKGKG
jgi:prefoldin beta subunit